MLDSSATERARRKRVLVVDDNDDTVDTFGQLVLALGHDLRVAVRGEDAVDLTEQFSPDAVLLDLGLPDLRGEEVARRIRRRDGGTQRLLVAVTGWDQPADVARSYAAGFDHHVVKPAGLAEFRTLLGQAPPPPVARPANDPLPRLLIIDDPIVTSSLRRVLRDTWTVDAASTVDDLVAGLEDPARFTCVLCDPSFARSAGTRLMPAVLRFERERPGLVWTSSAALDPSTHGRRMLPKPFGRAALLAALAIGRADVAAS
jgi:CheY-like chemotaxis protein